MRALVDIRHGAGAVDAARTEALCAFVAERLRLPEDAEVSVTYINDAEMASLNAEFRGMEGPTDVLSFECDNIEDGFPTAEAAPEATYALGDVIIAPDVAARQAEEFGNTFQQELDMLLVHGLLHLNGYDHMNDADAEAMETLQARLLAEWAEGTHPEGGAQ